MLYSRTTFIVKDVKDALKSKKLKRRVYGNEDGFSSSLVGRGRTQGREDGNRGSHVPSLKLPVKLNVTGVKNEGILKDIIHSGGGQMVMKNLVTITVMVWFKTIPMKETWVTI